MLSALNDVSGAPVDWFFGYKLPYHARPKGKSVAQGPVATGFEYMYLDADGTHPLQLSKNKLTDPSSAFQRTLTELFCIGGPVPADTGWILYNDEIPGTKSNDGSKGHTKGVLGFDLESDSALWMLHSTPRWPHPADPGFPENEKQYGQTFLCITLADVKTAESIAAQMVEQQEPQVYGCRLPDALPKTSKLLELGQGTDEPTPKNPSAIEIQSRGGQSFRVIAKNRHWGQDFWIDDVGPTLDTSLNVESWRRGRVPDTAEPGGKDHVDDVQSINLAPLGADFAWSYTKDHAKWGIGEGSDWVCIADINRMVSQEKRGGGTICFPHKKLNAWLKSIEVLFPNAK